MLAMMKPQQTHAAYSSANSKLEGDPRRRSLRTPTLRATLTTSSPVLTTSPCVMRMLSPSSKMEETMTDTEVKSQSSHLDKGVVLRFSRLLLTIR